MRYIESGRAKMRIEESTAKNQGRIDLGRDVVAVVKNIGSTRTTGTTVTETEKETRGKRMQRMPLGSITPPRGNLRSGGLGS